MQGISDIKEAEAFFAPSFDMGFPFNTIFKQLTKQVEKELRNMDSEIPTFDESQSKKVSNQQMPMGISISISSSGGQPRINVQELGKSKAPLKAVKDNIPEIKLSEEQLTKLSKLPKEEPETSVRRLTNKIIYEINLPGVEDKNLIITRLQNSIEIKAFTKDKAFFKLIPVALPILNSELKDGKLVLELKPSH